MKLTRLDTRGYKQRAYVTRSKVNKKGNILPQMNIMKKIGTYIFILIKQVEHYLQNKKDKQ